MTNLIVKRLALTVVTLWLLSVIVFAGGQLLPGDAGRAILGPLADAGAVANLNHALGTDRPIVTQYLDWAGRFVTGDMSRSYAFRAPVAPFVLTALGYSAKLGALAFALVVPLGIAGGVWAALNAGRPVDRIVTTLGLSASVVPEFVTGIVLMIVFGIWLKLLPISAAWPPGAGPLTELRYLILPSLPLVLVLFGYLARMARAGTIAALQADYTRTAILKGLPRSRVIWRHVLPNALVPTIAVAAIQIGYLIGGLVVIEVLFRYPGIGSLIFTAARARDFPMLEAGVMVIGLIYALATLAADLLTAFLNPRIRYGAGL
jgi:peptide/nickel transport system permease protein